MIRRFLFAIMLVLIVLSVPAGAEDAAFGGVGLQVVPTINGDLVVLNVLKGAPAEAKGVQPGDLIFQVDDFALHGSEFGKVVSEHLWGAIGSSVVLHLRRPGKAGVMQVEVVRSNIDPRLTVTPTVQGGTSTQESRSK